MSRTVLSCPRCESSLIQIESVHYSDGGALLDRHCPECGHRDELSVATSLAELLVTYSRELARSLEELADCLAAAGELWLSDVQ